MPAAHLIRCFLHRAAVLAMLLPFLALSALPSGFMPMTSGDGTLTLVLCTPDGPQELTVDLGTGNGTDAAKARGCPWALAHAAFLTPVQPPAPTAALLLVRADPSTQATHLRPASLPVRIAARAPPSLV